MNISVCMAAYNGEAYIEEQITSIIKQLNESDELIIYDDVSTDNTSEIIKTFSIDRRVKYFRGLNNLGVIRAFDNALSVCVNEVIVLSDQDDIWIDGKIEYIRKIFKNNEVSALLHNALIFEEDGKVIKKFYEFPLDVKQINIWKLLIKNKVIGCCFAFRRDILNNALPIPRFVSMHDWWLASVAFTSGKVLYTDQVFIKYRRHQNNVSVMKRQGLIKIISSRIMNAIALLILQYRISKK